ncbi:MAG: sulfatase-like hydrolase/transferase [Lentisphaerae bacterium]|nr:sulfatase-like hydrolase/transferase [Lentisphaerota bacterium]
MTAGGYYTAVAGHYEPERNLSRGWHEQVPMHRRGPLYESWMAHIRTGRNDVGWSSGTIDRDATDGSSARLTERIIRMIDAADASGMPFFLHLCYDDPHPPYFVPRPYDTMFDPAELPLPPRGDNDALPVWQDECRKQCGTQEATDMDTRRVVAAYYGMIAYVDDQLRRVHDALDQRGLLENTWVILSSDHGDYTGEKGLFNKSESLYECLLHVPLIIVPPPGTPGSRPEHIDHLVNTIDLFPTILNLAGLDIPDYAQGHDLVEWVAEGASTPLRDALFAQVGAYLGTLGTTFPGGIATAGRHPGLLQGARTKTHSYVRDPDYGDEAYDLQTDPHELSDLLRASPSGSTPEVDALKRQVDTFEAQCLALRNRLGVIPGERGFVLGWE